MLYARLRKRKGETDAGLTGFRHMGPQRHIEHLGVVGGAGCLPIARMGIDGVGEVMLAAIATWIWP